jgi:hypothetical protein
VSDLFNDNNEKLLDIQEFDIWLENGINRGWITPPFCNTHDGDPYMTEEEEKDWEDGGDPCQPVVKLIV